MIILELPNKDAKNCKGPCVLAKWIAITAEKIDPNMEVKFINSNDQLNKPRKFLTMYMVAIQPHNDMVLADRDKPKDMASVSVKVKLPIPEVDFLFYPLGT
jgi:hypothetical protein